MAIGALWRMNESSLLDQKFARANVTPPVVNAVHGTDPVLWDQQFGGKVAKVSVVGSVRVAHVVQKFIGPDQDDVPLLVAEQLFRTYTS